MSEQNTPNTRKYVFALAFIRRFRLDGVLRANIKALTFSIILALAVLAAPAALARHKTPPAPATNVSSTNTNNNVNVNKNVNKNENKIDIDIENNQTQTQNVTLGARVAAVPKTLPATGPSSMILSLMAGAIPLGLYLRKFKLPPKEILLKS